MAAQVNITLNVAQSNLNRDIVREKLEDARIGRRVCVSAYEADPTAEKSEACEAADLWVTQLANLLNALS